VAAPQIVRVQAELLHRLNDCWVHPTHAVYVTDQFTAGEHPDEFAVNWPFPDPHDSMLNA